MHILKSRLAVAVAFLLLALLAACNAETAGPSQTPTAVGGPTPGAPLLEWATDAAWHAPGQEAIGTQARDLTGMDVRSVPFTNTADYQAAVQSRIDTADSFPAFDWWFALRMKELVDGKQIADVTDIWEKHIAAGEYTRDLMETFSFAGRAYGLPKSISYWVVFYNKAIFTEHGLSVPASWEELLAVAGKLKQAGVTPFGLDVDTCSWCSFIWFQELMVRTDPRLYVNLMNGTRARYDDPEVLAVMESWKSLIDAGYFTPPGKVNIETSAEQFARGDFAMFLIGDWWTESVETSGMRAGEDYDLFIMPGATTAGQHGLIIESRPMVVAQASKYREAALKLADYFMSVEGQTTWARASKTNSPNLKVPEDARPPHLRSLARDVASGRYNVFVRFWEATPSPIADEAVKLFAEFVHQPERYRELMSDAADFADRYWSTHR